MFSVRNPKIKFDEHVADMNLKIVSPDIKQHNTGKSYKQPVIQYQRQRDFVGSQVYTGFSTEQRRLVKQDAGDQELVNWKEQMPMGIPHKGFLIEKCNDNVIDFLSKSYNMNSAT